MKILKPFKMILIMILLLLVQGSAFVIDPAKNANWHNERGLFFLRFENYYGAIEEFRLAIALNHKTQASGVFYNNLGTAYYKLGVYAPAAQCFQKAISFDPNFVQYYQNLIDTYKSQKKLNSEIKKYENKVKKKPNNSRAHLMLGLMYKNSKNNAAAVYNLREFKRLEPDLDITKQVDVMIKEMR